MEYRSIGRTGVRVSRLCLGTLTFGRESDEQTSAAIFHRCRDEGINFLDTGNIYSMGRTEEIVGSLLSDCRDEIIINTKAGCAMGPGVNDRGLSRRHLMMAVEGSLKRLRTDRIDFYYVHTFDPSTPMETTLRALDDLTAQGKILHPAVSNWAAWQIAKALGISARRELARFACIELLYNLVKRQAEVELLPLAADEGLGVIVFNSLGGGLLSGKYTTSERPRTGRLAEDTLYMTRYREPVYYEIAERVKAYAEKRGMNPASLSIAWVMSHPAVTAPIIGARNLEQLEAWLAAAKLNMTPEWRLEVSSLSVQPPPATDRLEEQTQEEA